LQHSAPIELLSVVHSVEAVAATIRLHSPSKVTLAHSQS
jgi:hypothetical protein